MFTLLVPQALRRLTAWERKLFQCLGVLVWMLRYAGQQSSEQLMGGLCRAECSLHSSVSGRATVIFPAVLIIHLRDLKSVLLQFPYHTVIYKNKIRALLLLRKP